MTGVAVKVTEAPSQTEMPGLAAMETDGVTFSITVMAIALLVAVGVVVHIPVAVRTAVITLPLVSVLSVYVLPVAACSTLSLNH